MPESSRAWAIAAVGQSRASNETISRGAIGMDGDLCLGSAARPWASIGAFENPIIATGCCSSGKFWPVGVEQNGVEFVEAEVRKHSGE